jgi:hypothetical protein
MRTKKLLLVVPALLLFLLFPYKAFGCSCLAPPTVQDEFDRSENVLVANLKGFEEIDRFADGEKIHRTYAGILEVEKVYKGNLRVKGTIKIFSGGGGDCTAGFGKSDIGMSILFYMGGPRKVAKGASPLYSFSICSRSGSLKSVAADLKYLDNRSALAGKTRLSGAIAAWGENISLPSVSGLSVKISGSNFQQELKTDMDGSFEIWDIPPGDYELAFQVPHGWKMVGSRVLPAKDRNGWKEATGNTVSISIVAGKQTEVASSLKIDNEISGKVLSPTGSPMKGVCVSAYWLTPTSDSYMIPSNCTNEKGDFKISELPPGKYRIEVNNRGAVTASNPFETFYYPGVQDKEKAEAVFVKEGVSVQDLVIRVAKTLSLIKISGQLTYKGGNPVPNEEVRFDPRDNTKHERVEVETDENGKFSFELPIGAIGDLKAKTNIWVIQFEKCAEALTLRKTRTGRAADIQSNVIPIDGQGPQENLKLIYPIICQ